MTQPRYPQQYALQNAQLLLVYACLRTDVFLVLQGGGRRRCSLADRLRTTNRDAGEPDVIHYYLTRPKQAPGTCKKHSLHLSSLSLPATTLSRRRLAPTPLPSSALPPGIPLSSAHISCAQQRNTRVSQPKPRAQEQYHSGRPKRSIAESCCAHSIPSQETPHHLRFA
jgi:hypothetical protein